MKHIFTVHSPITFICAVSICKDLNISEKDVIIISAGYKVPFIYGSVVKPFNEVNSGIFSKLFTFDVPKKYDSYINQLTESEKFIAYVDLMHYWQRMLVTHANCKSFNFLEEGTASYLKPDTLEELTHLAKNQEFRINSLKGYFNLLYFSLRGYNHRLLNLPFWPFMYRYMPDVKYYGFSEHTYPGVQADKRRVIKFWSSEKETNSDKLENAIIWVEDSFNKQYVSRQSDVDAALKQSVYYIKTKFGKTHDHWVKLRPAMGSDKSEIIPHLENAGIRYRILENETPLELILSKSENVVLVGARSSLLFYAEIMGHNSYSYFRLLKNRKHNTFESMDFFWDTVKHIPANGNHNDDKKTRND